MIPPYTIQYTVPFKKHAQTNRYASVDSVACEEFLLELLDRGFRITAIEHEGLALERKDFDRMIKAAAGALAARHVCASLNIKPEEERHRFGFAARSARTSCCRTPIWPTPS